MVPRLPRVAFTIVLNGERHLQHNDFAGQVLSMVDHWSIVEGASLSGGSTSWCWEMPPQYHQDGRSIDGTIKYLKDLSQRHSSLHVNVGTGMWSSKDQMVNIGLDSLRQEVASFPCFLWEFDVDEQWVAGDLLAAEQMLWQNRLTAALFSSNQYVGPHLVARGAWGSNMGRLYLWGGEPFISHEPPRLERVERTGLLPQRFNHYSYYWEEDVQFKSLWYRGHEQVYKNWKRLQQQESSDFPQPLTALFGEGSEYARDSWIEWINIPAP